MSGDCAGELKVTLTDAKGVAVPFKVVDKDKTYRVEFQTSVVGVCTGVEAD